MTRTRRTFTALVCLTIGLAVYSSPAHADAVDDLTKLVRQAASTQNPVMAVMRGLASMGDFDLNQSQIKRALSKANLPAGGMLDKVLGPTKRLTKRGSKVVIERTQATTVRLDTGHAIQLGKRVSAEFRVSGQHDALIDKVEGIKVGESASSLYDLWKIKFTRQNGRPVAMITAGAFVFSKTVTVDLSGLSGNAPTSAGMTSVINSTTN